MMDTYYVAHCRCIALNAMTSLNSTPLGIISRRHVVAHVVVDYECYRFE